MMRKCECQKKKTVTSPIKFKKSAKLALRVILGNQKAEVFIFIEKDITI